MKSFAMLAICVIVTVSLIACDTYGVMELYPYQKADTWLCESIDYRIQFTYNENGILEVTADQLVWRDQEYMVYMSCQGSRFSVLYFDDIGEDGIGEEDILFAGTWKYRGNKLVLEIKKDNLFNGEIAELVFVPAE